VLVRGNAVQQLAPKKYPAKIRFLGDEDSSIANLNIYVQILQWNESSKELVRGAALGVADDWLTTTNAEQLFFAQFVRGGGQF
jgi:hypothetical protein